MLYLTATRTELSSCAEDMFPVRTHGINIAEFPFLYRLKKQTHKQIVSPGVYSAIRELK